MQPLPHPNYPHSWRCPHRVNVPGPVPFTIGFELGDYDTVYQQAVHTWSQNNAKTEMELNMLYSMHEYHGLQVVQDLHYHSFIRTIVPDDYDAFYGANSHTIHRHRFDQLNASWNQIILTSGPLLTYDDYCSHYLPHMLVAPDTGAELDNGWPSPHSRVRRLRFDRLILQFMRQHL